MYKCYTGCSRGIKVLKTCAAERPKLVRSWQGRAVQHNETLSEWLYCAGSALADLADIAADRAADLDVRERASGALKQNLAQLRMLLLTDDVAPEVREFIEHELQKYRY